MEIEIGAVITVAGKLELLDELLNRRITRASTDTVSPALPLLEKVYKLGEYKRLAANLAVMEHRIRCELGNEETDKIARAARGEFGWRWDSGSVKAARRKARRVLTNLGVSAENLQGYRRLPLFAAACKKIERTLKAQAEAPIGLFARDAACACCPADRTAQA